MNKFFKNKKNIFALLSMLTIQICALFYYSNHFYAEGYLPTPFIYDKANTFMDFFNPLFWAEKNGRYTEWQSVYPPLNFIILRIFSTFIINDYCFLNPTYLRTCGTDLIYVLIVIYCAIPFFFLRTDLWKRLTISELALLYLIILTSTPMLFALERGNLIILCLIFLPFALSNSCFIRIIGISILINIKPYFVLLYLTQFLKKSYTELILCVLLTIVIFIFSGLIIDFNFVNIFNNLIQFSNKDLFATKELLALPSSISAISKSLMSPGINELGFELSNISIKIIVNLIETFKKVSIALLLILAFLNNEKLNYRKLTFIAIVLITNLSYTTGGYSLIFYLPLVPIVFNFKYSKFYLLCIIILFLPIDMIRLSEFQNGVQDVYLSGLKVPTYWSLGIGVILRPLLNFFILLMLIFELFQKLKFNVFYWK